VPRYDEELRDPSCRIGVGILKKMNIWNGELGLQYLAFVLSAIV
jgi:hypothetical protein